MRCPDEKNIGRYLDGELSSPEEQALAEHLRACPECRERIRKAARAGALIREAVMTSPRGSACPEIEAILAAAGAGEAGGLESHLASCPGCAALFAAAREAAETAAIRKEKLPGIPAELDRRARLALRGYPQSREGGGPFPLAAEPPEPYRSARRPRDGREDNPPGL